MCISNFKCKKGEKNRERLPDFGEVIGEGMTNTELYPSAGLLFFFTYHTPATIKLATRNTITIAIEAAAPALRPSPPACPELLLLPWLAPKFVFLFMLGAFGEPMVPFWGDESGVALVGVANGN